MNSWKSSSLGACTPPFTTLKCGTGSRGASRDPAKLCHRERPATEAKARAAAMDTPTTALAPRRDLSAVPSSSSSAASRSDKVSKDRPDKASRISPLTAAAASRTPCPEKRVGSPSRRSTASREPVDAPAGTPACARTPWLATSVTARVGRALESRISIACSFSTVMPTTPPLSVCVPPSWSHPLAPRAVGAGPPNLTNVQLRAPLHRFGVARQISDPPPITDPRRRSAIRVDVASRR